VPRVPGTAVGKGCFSFFLKKTYAESPRQRPSAKTVFYFKKTLLRARATTLGKAGNTLAVQIFPRVAERHCQMPSAKAPLPTARSAKRPHFVFFHIDKHTHIYIYISTSSYTPHVSTSSDTPQVHRNKSTNPQNVSNPTKQVQNMIN
jgi:hypothetical protein